MKFIMTVASRIWIGVAGLALLAIGCGPQPKPAGKVSGSVSYNGQVVEEGLVNFRSAAGIGAQAPLENGEFRIEGLLDAGDYKVYLSAPLPEPQPPGSNPEAVAPFLVPARFCSPATTPVEVTVSEGENMLQIEFTDDPNATPEPTVETESSDQE